MIGEPGFQLLINERKIATTVKRLASAIQNDYQDKNPLLVGILKGSFVFLSDLIRCLEITLEIDFVRLSSYGGGTLSSGQITEVHGLSCAVQDRHLLIVEDIIDTGLTTAFLFDYLQRQGPASIKVCALAEKPARRKSSIKIDYLGFTVPDQFIVGYGLDLDEKYRNLPAIYALNRPGIDP